MQRKMNLLEMAHGLLCNVPDDDTTAESGDEWRKLRAEWIDRYFHVIKDQSTKVHNKQIAEQNRGIEQYLAS